MIEMGAGRAVFSSAAGAARASALARPHARAWWQIALAMGLGLMTLLATARSLADRWSPLIALGATLIALATRGFRAGVPHRSDHAIALLLVAGIIGVPLFGYSWGVAQWAQSGAVGWPLALTVLAAIALIATALQSGRLAEQIAGQVAIWSAVAWVIAPLSGIGAVLIGGTITTLALHWQQAADRAETDRMARLAREATRAQAILADFEATGQGWFWETGPGGEIRYISAPVAEWLGHNPAELAGQPFTGIFRPEILPPGSLGDDAGGHGERTLAFHLTARSAFSDLLVRGATPSGERWWAISGRPIHDAAEAFMGFRGSGADLTERRRTQEHVSRLAHFDSLTGLSNRFFMAQALDKILSAAHVRQRACAVLLIDLDRFKQVNDTLGHPAGDQLLQHVAQRLQRGVAPAARVGRLGGDEFQVIVPARVERAMLAQIAEHVIDSLSQPYTLDAGRVTIGASIGIAIAPDDGETAEALIRNADLALYAAKDAGRGRFHFFAADLHNDAQERRQLEGDLRDALGHGQLALYYQPVVQTATERITGFEALMRWNHPEHGFIPPSRFIPIAEETGLIAQIGDWALRQACTDMAHWPADVRVAVNVSPLQFANPALPGLITSALASAQIDPDRLELEITESVFINDDSGTEAMFRALKRIGVRLALDDFGTGYSSLGYLKKAPFDKIKIDQSFVRGATQPGSRNGAIIASIVSLAEALNMETTAEGVETLDELDLVRLLGCSHVQGFVYAHPLTARAAGERLGSGLAAIAQGPRAARALRQSLLRRVVLEHGGRRDPATVRNISQTGALVEGLRAVATGTVFRVHLADGHCVTGTARWSDDNRMGLEFSTPLALDATGRIAIIAARRSPREG